MDRDTANGIVVAGLIVAAMVGVFWYESTQFGEFAVTWTVSEMQIAERSASLAAGQSADIEAVASGGAISAVRVTLSWSDDIGAADRFRLAVQGPAGFEGASREGDAGPLTITVPVRDVPETMTVPARSAGDAEDIAARQHASDAGEGTWRATVTLLSAPGTTTGGVETQPDGNNGYTVSVTLVTFAPLAGGPPA